MVFHPDDKEMGTFIYMYTHARVGEESIRAVCLADYIKEKYPWGNVYALLQLHTENIPFKTVQAFKEHLKNAPLGLLVPMYPERRKTA